MLCQDSVYLQIEIAQHMTAQQCLEKGHNEIKNSLFFFTFEDNST